MLTGLFASCSSHIVIAQVCVGRREKLSVFGDDYDTPDGTGKPDLVCLSRIELETNRVLHFYDSYLCS